MNQVESTSAKYVEVLQALAGNLVWAELQAFGKNGHGHGRRQGHTCFVQNTESV